MKALVTGSAGFVASHLVELLLKKGYDVIGIDNMVNGQQENIDMFKDNPKYIFVKGDVSATHYDGSFKQFSPVPISYDNLFKDVDYVFHLAGLADIIPSIERPEEYYQANVTGTLRVLEESRKAGVKKFVYAASSSCYGIPDKTPTDESADIRPEYPYAVTKFLGEQLALSWCQIYKLPVVSLRLFNVYGPRARNNKVYGAVFKTFLSQKFHDKPFTIIGDGNQERDFVFVSDVAEAFLLAAESPLTGRVYNVGGGHPESVKYLSELIGGVKHPRVYLPWRPGEPMITHANISLIKEELNWTPLVSFKEGVSEMMKDMSYWENTPAWTKDEVLEATKTWYNTLGDKQ
jgi:UDP-glucose 4-epimerase